jgi:hypothetical protein
MQEKEMLPDVARCCKRVKALQTTHIGEWRPYKNAGNVVDPDIPHGPWSLPTVPPRQTPTVIPHVALAAAHEGLSGGRRFEFEGEVAWLHSERVVCSTER